MFHVFCNLSVLLSEPWRLRQISSRAQIFAGLTFPFPVAILFFLFFRRCIVDGAGKAGPRPDRGDMG